MFAAACPMIAQALMMVILLLHGQWLFAAMIAPAYSPVVSLLLTLPSPPGPAEGPDLQQATIDVGITGDADDRAADLRHAPSQPTIAAALRTPAMARHCGPLA